MVPSDSSPSSPPHRRFVRTRTSAVPSSPSTCARRALCSSASCDATLLCAALPCGAPWGRRGGAWGRRGTMAALWGRPRGRYRDPCERYEGAAGALRGRYAWRRGAGSLRTRRLRLVRWLAAAPLLATMWLWLYPSPPHGLKSQWKPWLPSALACWQKLRLARWLRALLATMGFGYTHPTPPHGSRSLAGTMVAVGFGMLVEVSGWHVG